MANKAERYRPNLIVDEKTDQVKSISLNNELNRIWEVLAALEGRTGITALLSGATIDGDLTITGNIRAANFAIPNPASATSAPINQFGNQVQLVERSTSTGLNEQRISLVGTTQRWTISGKLGTGVSETLECNYGPPTAWGIGVTPDPSFFLKIGGATQVAGTLNATGAVDFDSTLNVDGNATVVGTLLGNPIFGVWTNTSSTAGTGDFSWPTEIHGNATYFVRQASNTEIKILVAGTYKVYFHSRSETTANGEFTIQKNGTVIAKDFGPTLTAGVTCSTITTVAANDLIKVNLAVAGDRYGDANSTTLLTIDRLN